MKQLDEDNNSSYKHIDIKHAKKQKKTKNNQTKICTQTIQNGVTKKCSI